jgi:DNA modification methylase
MNSVRDEWESSDGSVRLLLADCVDVLPQLAGVAAVVTDPPYGISFVKGSSGSVGAYHGGAESAAASRGCEPIKGDDAPFDPSALLAFPNCLIWGANHFCNRLPAGKGRWLAWDKLERLDSFDSFSDVEFAWHSLGRASRVFSYLWKGGCACRKLGENNGRRDHPTQKPVALMAWSILQAGAMPGDLVCDPYMGSGTTGVASLRLGRRFCGVEIEPQYFEIAVARCRRELAQPRLPFVEPARETQAVLFAERIEG